MEPDYQVLEEVHEVEGGDQAGMPQLDPSSFSSQLFWLTVTFAVLYLLMARGVIPRIRSVLEKRQTQITHDLDAAEKAKMDAEKAKASYEKAFLEAQNKANALLQDAQSEIDAMVSTENTKLDEKLSKEMSKAEASITKQREAAREQIKPMVQELTAAIVEKLIDAKPAAKKLEAAVTKQMENA